MFTDAALLFLAGSAVLLLTTFLQRRDERREVRDIEVWQRMHTIKETLTAVPTAQFEPIFDTAGDTGEITPPDVVQPTVNFVCPINLRRVDATLPSRELNGEFIGFCSRDCVAAWDKLSIEEKHDLLEAVDEINE